MNREHGEQDAGGLVPGADDYGGYTIEELSDYLDSGRTPRNEEIERSPGSRIALDALERLQRLSPSLLAADTAAEERPDEGWVRRILSGISWESRAGRRIPFDSGQKGDDLGITEGAVRGVIRGAEEAIERIVVGRCRLIGDVTAPGESIRVSLDASVPYGEPIPALAERLRAEVARRLRTHTDLNVAGIDVRIRDVRSANGTGESS